MALSNYSGTTTQWPSGLTVAHSFDPELFAEWGVAMGEEFAGKGGVLILLDDVEITHARTRTRTHTHSHSLDCSLMYDHNHLFCSLMLIRVFASIYFRTQSPTSSLASSMIGSERPVWSWCERRSCGQWRKILRVSQWRRPLPRMDSGMLPYLLLKEPLTYIAPSRPLLRSTSEVILVHEPSKYRHAGRDSI